MSRYAQATLPPATDPFTPLTARRMGPVRRFFHEHPAVMDWIVTLWYLVPAGLTLTFPSLLEASGTAARTGPELLAGAILALLAGGALLRRRHEPVLALGVVTAAMATSLLVTGDTTGIEIASVLALYAVAAYRPPTTAWLSLLALNLAYAASHAAWYRNPLGEQALVSTDGSGELVYTQLTATQALIVTTSSELALSVVALALGAAARGRRLHVNSLVERTAQLALERDQREQLALVAERNRIAREMHDVVAHSLSVMVALSDGAAASLDRRPEQAHEALAELSAAGRSALADTRRVLDVLREGGTPDDADGAVLGPDGPTDEGATPLTPQPTATPTLGDLVSRFQTAGLPVTFQESGPALPPDAGLRLAVYRIVQEALTNVLRHAPTSPRIDVTMERWADRVVIEVDNDDGADTGSSVGGRGLVGMRQRAAVYDGHVEAGATMTGWRVRALLRWTKEDA